MELSVSLLIYVFYVQIYVSSPLCRESLKTVEKVESCPGNQDEWKYRGERKNCSSVTQSCVKPDEFLYHCLINEFINDTLEVCAPVAIILGQNCAEFNMHGAVIQDNPYAKCNDSDPPCPFRYNSTDSYKYKRCYNYIQKEDNTKLIRLQNDCRSEENVWFIIAIFLMILYALSSIGVVVLIRRRGLCTRKPEETPRGDTTNIKKEREVQLSGITKTDIEEHDEQGRLEEPLICPTKKDKNKTEQEEKGKSSPNPTRRTRIGSPKWVSSIYIGNKYCGMAFLNPKTPEDVVPVGNIERIGALLDKDGKIEEFGDNAREKYIENCERNTKSIFLDELEIDHAEIKTDKKTFQTVKVYQEIIRYLCRRIYKEISTSKDKKKDDEVLHVITVPHHWHSKIKNLQKVFEEALSGQDKKENLHIHVQLRELALSPYIHEVKASVLCLNFNVDNLAFKRGTTYANLHVGSRYCNLMFLKAADSSKQDEILSETTPEKWDITPENQFLEIFKEIFSAPTVEIWKNKHHSEYVSLMYQFEEQRKKMCEFTVEIEKFEFKLSSRLRDLHELSLKDIEKKAGEIQGLELKEDGTKFIMSWSLLKKCFSEVRAKTHEIIQKHANTFRNNDVHCVIMTGSYSQMKKFLFEAEKKWFHELQVPVTVAIPVHLGSTFAMGAAYKVFHE